MAVHLVGGGGASLNQHLRLTLNGMLLSSSLTFIRFAMWTKYYGYVACLDPEEKEEAQQEATRRKVKGRIGYNVA